MWVPRGEGGYLLLSFIMCGMVLESLTLGLGLTSSLPDIYSSVSVSYSYWVSLPELMDIRRFVTVSSTGHRYLPIEYW